MREFICHNACMHSTDACTTCRSETREEALQHAPGQPIILLRAIPVRVRSICARAVAYTVTDVLVEWDEEACYHLRWEASWLVRRVVAVPEVERLPEAV